VTKSSITNVLLLLVVLAGAVAFFVDDKINSEKAKNAKLQSALKTEPAPALEVPKNPFNDAEMAVYRRIVTAYATGDFAGALQLADNAMEQSETSAEFRDWLTRQWPILMTTQAWMKIK
jgi:hypothetical protein